MPPRGWSYTLLAWALVQMPALRPLAKYVVPARETAGLMLVAVWLVISVTAVSTLIHGHQPWLRKMLASRWLAVAAIALLAVVVWWLYPVADGLKVTGGGSDSDDAIILGARAFARGESPYWQRTYLLLPLSPGPGWIAMLAPLVLTGLYPLAGPLALALVAVLTARQFGWRLSNLLLLVLLSSPIVWELLVVGNDLLTLGALLAAMGILMLGRPRPGWSMVLAVALGTAATGRLPLAYLPLLYGWMLWQGSPRGSGRQAATFAFVGLGVCGLWHGIFAVFAAGRYPPAHLLVEGGTLFGSAEGKAALVVAAVVLSAFLWWVPWRERKLESSQVALLWLGVFLPLLVASVESLGAGSWRLGLWEGATYWALAIPLGAAWTLVRGEEVRAE